MKYTAIQYEADRMDSEMVFDDDGIKPMYGDDSYAVIIDGGRNCYGFNMDVYKEYQSQAYELLDSFGGVPMYYPTYKDAMDYAGVAYNPTLCGKLKKWAETGDDENTDSVIEFMSLVTGHEWSVVEVRGYSQGDYCKVIFSDRHTEEIAEYYGDIYLGNFASFNVTDEDDPDDSCSGYIVQDSKVWNDETLKAELCKQIGCKPEELTIQVIDTAKTRTVTEYTYRTV